MSTTFLEKSQSAGNRQTWTMSMWIKTSVNNDEQPLFSSASDSNNQDLAYIEAGGNLRWWTYQSAAYVGQLRTSRVLRDANAWYHLVFVFDSTNATADDRMRIYINGVQETSFAARNNPAQNSNTLWNGTLDQTIGHDASGGYADEFDGSMSHINFIDGTAYEPTAFGEYDANGVWTIKTSPSVTYGTNGFFILKDGNSVTDQSGNSNNFTVQASGTLTKTEDSPSNVFCTLNPLNQSNSGYVFSNGNTKGTVSGQWLSGTGTLAMSSGKYYWEVKYGSGNYGIGIAGWGTVSSDISNLSTANVGFVSRYTGGYELFQNGSSIYRSTANTNNGTYGTLATAGDIIMVAFDADNLKLYTGFNGTWNNSSNPATGANPMYTVPSGYEYTPSGSIETGSLEFNFGNGYFGTTAVASAGTNASGNGIFEYDVPTGYTALSTKGLNL